MKFKFYFFKFFLLLFCSIPLLKASEQIDQNFKNTEQMAGDIRLENKQIANIIEKMVMSGRISNEEGSKVKREIASVKEDDLQKLKKQVMSDVRNKKFQDN